MGALLQPSSMLSVELWVFLERIINVIMNPTRWWQRRVGARPRSGHTCCAWLRCGGASGQSDEQYGNQWAHGDGFLKMVCTVIEMRDVPKNRAWTVPMLLLCEI